MLCLLPWKRGAGRVGITDMKSFIAIASSILLCSCADMYITRTEVATPGGGGAAPIDAKDYGKGVRMTTNCGVGASNPVAIYVRPFCMDSAVFEGNEALTDGEMPIRKAIAPVEFAEDLKQQLEKIAPTRILKDNETPRVGWLVEGQFDKVDGGTPGGESYLALHVKVTDVARGMVVYEFDMTGGNRGPFGAIYASGMGRATHFDLRNAAERIYIALSANPYHFGQHSGTVLPE
jgi:hypothetical protein